MKIHLDYMLWENYGCYCTFNDKLFFNLLNLSDKIELFTTPPNPSDSFTYR